MKLKRKCIYSLKMILKEQLRDILDSNGLSLSQLAKDTDIPVQTLHNWLSGVEPRSLSQVKKVADHLNISIDFLCFEPDKTAQTNLDDYSEEINAGVFEVVLRRIKRKK